MKYLLIIFSVVCLAGCASSNISLTANIPDTQEVDIHITTKHKDTQ